MLILLREKQCSKMSLGWDTGLCHWHHSPVNGTPWGRKDGAFHCMLLHTLLHFAKAWKKFLLVLDEKLFHRISKVACACRVAVLQNYHDVLIICRHKNFHVQRWPYFHTNPARHVHMIVVSVIIQTHVGMGFWTWSSKAVTTSVKILKCITLNKEKKLLLFAFLTKSLEINLTIIQLTCGLCLNKWWF